MPVEPRRSTGHHTRRGDPSPYPAIVTVFTSIASQAALITALLYFFGRVHMSAMYNYFGVDANSLGFSTSDYVINSLNATLPPVMLCALAILSKVSPWSSTWTEQST